MPPVTLPTELWLVIIDFIIEALVNPAYLCNYENFPEVNHSFVVLPRVVPSFQELRLVCRAFNELLKTPPLLFMQQPKAEIPKGTRALFISWADNSLSCLRRLLEDPSRSRRIVTLCIPCDASTEFRGLSLFETLVKNSHLLSGVRSLAFGVVVEHENSLDGTFWHTLNEAFPALVYLALHPKLMYAIELSKEAKPKVTFEKLEILKIGGHFDPYYGLNLPLLRHVAVGCSYQRVIETLARSPRLESVLLRAVHSEGTIDLSLLPKLKVLGIPVYGKNTPVPLPRDCAGHLCAYVTIDCRAPALLQWVKRVASYFHNVPQIALDLTLMDLDLYWDHRRYYESAIRRSLPELRSNGLVIDHLPFCASYIVIKRIAVEPKVSSSLKVSSTARSETPWDRWNRFRHAAYYRLHI